MGSRIGHLPNNLSRTNQFIGSSNWNNDAKFDGMMDDMRVYDRALDQNEVDQIYSGDLEQTVTLGGEDPSITLFWGDEDAGQTATVNASSPDAWDASNLLGVKPPGEFSFPLSGLQVGKTYYYRFLATNSAGSSWSPAVSVFSTGSFGFKTDSFADGNLLLWLDATDVNADDNLSNEPVGGVLDQWRDKSGASRHAGNGQGPEVRVDRWNGLSTLKFDGQSQYLRVSDSPAFDFGEDATIFIVAKGDTLADWRPILSKRGMDDVGWQFRKDNTDFATFTVRGTTGADGPRGATPINGETHVWAMRKSQFKRTQWADGNEEFNIDDRDPVPATTSDLVIGARDQNGISAFGGVEIGEILVFDSALSDGQVSQMQGHLAHKWGLTSEMSNSHPYKAIPPLFENRPEITLNSAYTFFFQSGTPVSLPITTNRPADAYGGTGLPAGLDVNSTSGLISGTPSATGSFTATLEASNQAGSYTKQVVFDIRDYSAWRFSSEIAFPGYTGSSQISDFPVYLEFNNSLSGFNYEQFSSPFGYDLRFVMVDGNEEIEYEVVSWNPGGISSFWLNLPRLDDNTTIKALWGNQNALVQPEYSKDGRIWNGYHGVWHMDGTADDLVKESKSSFHGTPNNFGTLREPGLIGTALSFDGVNDFSRFTARLPSPGRCEETLDLLLELRGYQSSQKQFDSRVRFGPWSPPEYPSAMVQCEGLLGCRCRWH